jgi:hypothetical protein
MISLHSKDLNPQEPGVLRSNSGRTRTDGCFQSGFVGTFSSYFSRPIVFSNVSDFEHIIVTYAFDGVVEGFLVFIVAHVGCTLDGELEVFAVTYAVDVIICTSGSSNAGADC